MTPRLRRSAAASSARTLAQAKVNLFLRILAREASGYHQLETLFCRLELGDDVVVRTNVEGRSLDCTGDVIPANGLGPVEWNLAWRAAVAYSETAGWPNDWAIEIAKRIPVGGGLGGGSADAGAVLRCLNALNPNPLDTRALLGLAGHLGADVPFLTSEAALALAWGRGERMLRVAAIPARHITLVCFPFGVSTRDAYSWLAETRSETAAPVPHIVADTNLANWADVARLAHNDFDAVVTRHVDQIATALATLRSIAARHGDSTAIVMLAGSGATAIMISDAPDPAVTARLSMSGIQHHTVDTRTATRVVDVEVSD